MIAAIVLAGLASAQDIVVDDFDGNGIVSWTDVSPIHSSGAPTGYFHGASDWFWAPDDGISAVCEPGHGMGGWCEAESTSFVVTHPTLSARLWSEESDAYLQARVTDTGRFVDQASSVGIETWETGEVDLASACGRELTLNWVTFAETWAFHALDTVLLTGDPCPGYVDADGDGLCLGGTDDDGDGSCVDPGEAVSLTTVVDCDDTVAGTNCLSLVQDPPTQGDPMRVVASGAVPGEIVGFVMGLAPGATCPTRLGGLCLEVARTASRHAVADASGTATVEFPVPVTTAYGTQLFVQAAAIRGAGGADSVKSNLASDVVGF